MWATRKLSCDKDTGDNLAPCRVIFAFNVSREWMLSSTFACSVGSFSPNASRAGALFSSNVSRKRLLLSSRTVYVLKPLHLTKRRA
jgi:hypothetical protein